MFNFILYLIIGFSLGGLVAIVYRKIPVLARLSEEEMIILERKRGLTQRLREINYKQHWLNLIIGLEKFLRRVKIIFLKTENLLSRWIERLRRSSQTMTQKSKEWIKQREQRRKITKDLSTGQSEGIPVKIEREEIISQPVEEENEEIPIGELDKPIKEEQKWIDLIIENPKNITAYKFLGLLYWRQHNYTDAKASLEMAVKFGSKDKKVKEILEELKKMGVKNNSGK
jgi:tetratricopeptide (TPR) repeat protein